MAEQEIGLVGLAVMGQNLALNIERNGFPISVFNRTTGKTLDFVKDQGQGKKIFGAKTIEEFVASLKSPRRIILMVKAGEPVDAMIGQIRPHLAKGDILIDGGNSFFRDTERRGKDLEADGILYIGTGVSGGEEGALSGPCIMPGGPRKAYDAIEPILVRIAAHVDDGPCVAYIGPGAAGHYVKMVHNGIEYGDMELIAEAYNIMRVALGMEAPAIGEVFSSWNDEQLGSYLIEITATCLAQGDPDTGKPLVDVILDKAGQKGTGKWTSQNALDLGVPIPTIDAAVSSRIISAYKTERVAAAGVLSGPAVGFDGDPGELIARLHDALYAAKVTSYAQGMTLLRAASAEYGFDLNYGEIARIWKGGCIIRARLLDRIKSAFRKNPDLPNLLVDPEFAGVITRGQAALREVVTTAVRLGIPCQALACSLAYFDAYRSERLPANMIQALRDLFGAHTYERVDREGSFHTRWGNKKC